MRLRRCERRERPALDNGYPNNVPLPLFTRDEMFSLVVAMRMRRLDDVTRVGNGQRGPLGGERETTGGDSTTSPALKRGAP